MVTRSGPFLVNEVSTAKVANKNSIFTEGIISTENDKEVQIVFVCKEPGQCASSLNLIQY